MKWILAVLALLYVLNPLDLFPDLIVGWGWLDDLLLVGLVWYFFFRRRMVPTDRPRSSGSHGRDKAETQGHDSTASADEGPDDLAQDPYDVLGLAPGASQEDIRIAYRELASQYHPDKVVHLGEEFQALAEKKFKAIQAAYDALRERQ